MKLTIHRGTKEIGGSCVELASEKTRIIIDLGLPLVDKEGDPFDIDVLRDKSIEDLISENILPNVKGLYTNGDRGIDAILLSHSHQDHCGLLRYVHPDIPVYMSQGAKLLIEISDLFIRNKANLCNARIFEMWQPFEMGDFIVTPHLVDHSAPDAAAFLLQSKSTGKRLFYSGDFRGHGRKKTVFDNLISHSPKHVDCLVMEGSLLGRAGGTGYEDENAVEIRMTEIFGTKENIAFVFCSSQNIDRIISVYRATKRTRQTLVIDLYTAYILDSLKVMSDRLPQYWWDDIKVKYYKYHAGVLANNDLGKLLYKYRRAKIELEEIKQDKKNVVMLVKDNSIFRVLLKHLINLDGAVAIYSMWEGYLQRSNLRETLERKSIKLECVHTSGHATERDLKRLEEAFKPRCLVPIHTFQPQEYVSLFHNVHMLNDGEEFVL